MIIHDLNLASSYCNRLLLMKKGELYKEGTPSEVINYQTIEETYETVVITIENPVNGKPALFPVPERYRLT